MTKNKGKTLRMKLTLVAAAVIGLTVVAARPAAAFTATNSCVQASFNMTTRPRSSIS